MNEVSTQMREQCQKWMIILQSQQNPIDDKETKRTIIALLSEMHKRLTILEGADLRSLEDITL